MRRRAPKGHEERTLFRLFLTRALPTEIMDSFCFPGGTWKCPPGAGIVFAFVEMYKAGSGARASLAPRVVFN